MPARWRMPTWSPDHAPPPLPRRPQGRIRRDPCPRRVPRWLAPRHRPGHPWRDGALGGHHTPGGEAGLLPPAGRPRRAGPGVSARRDPLRRAGRRQGNTAAPQETRSHPGWPVARRLGARDVHVGRREARGKGRPSPPGAARRLRASLHPADPVLARQHPGAIESACRR